MKPRALLHVLTGPTAVGKTELALRWAEQNNAEIVSCDSLLFYRGMDIGTAKPTKEELARVRHHLVDVCEVTDQMDIARYVSLARVAVEDILKRDRKVLVTGGSGFYLKAFLAPVADDIVISDEIRAEVAWCHEREGLPALVDRLRKLNPEGLGRLDIANPRRVLRALERCLASGKTLRILTEEFASKPGPFADFQVCCTCLTREPEELNCRIDLRIGQMLDAGLVEEVRRLDEAGLRRNLSAARAIGYRETLACLDGELTAGQLKMEIAKNTRGLVRKQRTWFRTQLSSHQVVSAANSDEKTLFPDLA